MCLWTMAKITIAQLHGYTLAGGCELAMMADLVAAAEHTQIGHPACVVSAPPATAASGRW